MKKLLIGLAAVFAILLAALAAVPYFFKDDIVAAVKTAANENLNAKLDFTDVDISVFRHFPKLSVGLEGLDVTGVDEFEGTRLIHCERLDVAVDLWSAIFGSDLTINGLHLQKPNIHVFVLSNGKANYDIAKPSPETPATAEPASGGAMKLESYSITDGKIVYDDRSLDMLAELDELNHTGKGDFAADVYDLVMKTDIGKLSVNYGGVKYLSKAHAIWDATLGADMGQMKFTFKENELKINDLQVNLDGWLSMPNDVDMLMDLTFGTPQNTFKSLLSIVPGAYTKDFDGMTANGTFQFGGFAKGKYNETTYPAFKLDFKVGNGDFKYPALPLGVSGINVDASINSPSQDLNAMTVAIPKFGLKIGSNPLEGYFNLKTPISDPTVDTKITGTLNLAELGKAFPMDGVQELTGIIGANMTLKAAQSQLDQQQYDQVNMAGSLSIRLFNYRAAGTPPVKINDLTMTFSPQFVDIQNFDARLGKSDLRAKGRVDNILAYFSPEKTMKGSVMLSSVFFDANEWTEPEPTAEAAAAGPGKVPSDPAPTASEKVFDQWDFDLNLDFKKLKYDVYDISDLFAKGHFTPNRMEVSDFGLKIGNSDLAGNGKILNAWNYLFDNQTVAGTVNLRSNLFDLNQFMTEEPAKPTAGSTAAAPPAEDVIPVPENMDMTLNADFKKVLYTNLTLENLDGQVVVKDRAARLQDCTANTLGGQIGLTGEYNTQNPAKPSFNMDMAIQNMGFKDAYSNFATVKSFAPIAQLIDGKFNTSLSMSGFLGKDMMPDMQSFSAAGFLETLSAIINNFKPAQAIGDKLNVAALKKWELKNTKNWFEIKDGQVSVKPFNVQMGEIAMQIGGSHGLTNEMNYQFLTKVPRKMLEQNPVGSAASSGLSFLSGEAAKYGVNIKQGEFVNVRFDMTGSLFSPKMAVKVLGSDGESTLKEQATGAATAVVEQAKDSLKNVANREIDKAKERAQAEVDRARDSLERLANQKIEEAKNKATEKVKDEVGKAAGEKAGEVIGEQGKKTVDEAKKQLDKWDPFKKKKKDGGQ